MSTQDLSAKLPPPHDEEPAQLRSDILDELRDHLDCAVDRERGRLELRGQSADAKTVWKSVIERFGDPANVARRLWFDAMRGRLMTQRVMLGVVLVVVLALVGWMAILSRSLTAVIDENQKATAAVLKRLGREQAVSPAEVNQELTPVRFVLVQGTSEGPPVVGTVVHFDQRPGDTPSRLGQLTETTDVQGVADFGLLPYGVYDLIVESPAGVLSEQVTLRPGRPISDRIAVPGPQPLGQVKFEFTPPDWAKWEWTTEDRQPPIGEPVLLVRYSHHSEVELNKRTWRSPEETKSVVVRSDGIYPGLIELVENQTSLVQFGGGGVGGVGESRITDDVDRLIDITSRVETLSLPPGPIRVTAEWLTVVENTAETGEGQLFVRPVSRSLNPDYARSLKATRKLDRFKFPLLLDIDSSLPQPQVIRIPANDPSTFDGEELPPLLPGGGGFF